MNSRRGRGFRPRQFERAHCLPDSKRENELVPWWHCAQNGRESFLDAKPASRQSKSIARVFGEKREVVRKGKRLERLEPLERLELASF
jgi:hypothetical protein